VGVICLGCWLLSSVDGLRSFGVYKDLENDFDVRMRVAGVFEFVIL
jgi:hypothetical protein